MNTNITLTASHYWPGPGTGLNTVRTWTQHLLWVEDVVDVSSQPALIAQWPGSLWASGTCALIAVLWTFD